MKNKDLLKDVEKFFDEKVERLGPSPQGADYNSPEAQEVRFDQVLKILPQNGEFFSLIDYGCGYGAMAEYMLKKNYQFDYQGFDISESMIKHARLHKPTQANWRYTTQESDLVAADYTIACGVFNMKFDADPERWKAFILESLQNLASLSKKGFSFNMLTSYSDADRMRPDLYYGDSLFFFDYCKRNFSRNVALLHDYNLYDWTILVRL